MPHEVHEADEARRRARRARGDDSEDSTVGNKNEETDNEVNRDHGDNVQVGRGNNHEELEEEETTEKAIEATVRRSTTSMFKRVLMFSDGAATSLYDDQMFITFDTLQELDDDTIKETCRAIKKPGAAAIGYQISELSVTRFKLFAFWARHMWRTCRSVND
jgi:hypothetical protein